MSHVPELQSVLVVGGCGFLGHHITTYLAQQRKIRTSVIDVNTSRNRCPDVSYHEADICSRAQVDEVLRKEEPQVIIHTASPLAQNQLGLQVYSRVNVDGTKTLLEAASDSPATYVMVYTSSAGIVFDFMHDLRNADESFPILKIPEQHDDYAYTKGVADELVRSFNSKGTLLTCCLRVCGMFGERDPGITSSVINSAKTGKAKFQVGDGKNQSDFTYVGNAVDAHVLAAESLVKEVASEKAGSSIAGEAFFITNDESRSFWKFARDVGTAAGYPTLEESVWSIPKSVGLIIGSLTDWVVWLTSFGQKQAKIGRFALNISTLTRTYNIEKAKTVLGYKPAISMDEGIRLTGIWYQNDIEGNKKNS